MLQPDASTQHKQKQWQCHGADAWFQRWLGQWGKALLDRVGVPEVALNSFTVRDGQINMWVAGESVPRQFEQTDYTVSLGCDYQDLDFTLTGDATTYQSSCVVEPIWSALCLITVDTRGSPWSGPYTHLPKLGCC